MDSIKFHFTRRFANELPTKYLLWRVLAFPLFMLCAQIIGFGQVSDSQSTTANRKTKTATVARISSPITLDGRLDEADWINASTIGDIVQREPHTGEAASEATVVKLLYDNRNLYIGVTCFDSQPDKIVATQMARDAALADDDNIQILIDTFHDRRNAFYFSTNPLGALLDALIIENGQLNKDWNAIWYVRAQRFDKGWSAEFAIPFKSLGFHQGQEIWGFNFSRRIKRKLEEDRWAAPRLEVKFLQVSEAGDIGNFTDIEQGRGLDIRPFISGKALHEDAADNDFKGKIGADIFYNLTPSLKWTTTINTDFAETEVDNRQINLTRFPLFFPEKRAFFLENTGVFNFANNQTPDALPFFSRRIGLLSGTEVPMLFGSKLTGKVGDYDIGVIGVRTRETALIDAKNFFIGRLKRSFFKQSYIGGIYTEGDPARRTSSRTYGSDLRLFTSHFLGREQNFGVDAFALKSANAGRYGKDVAYGLAARYPNDLFDLSIDWKHLPKNFQPALGFVQRSNVNKLAISAEYDPRPKNFLNVRQMFHEVRFTRYTRLDSGRVESWRLFTAPINYELNSGEHIEFNYAPQFERLFEPFAIADGVVLQPGDYRFTRWRLEANSAAKRAWKVDYTWWFGSFYSGHANQFTTGVQYNIAPHFQFEVELEQTFARLREGSFVARVFSLRADYSLSPYLTFYNLVEFDNESKNLGWQSRLRWILKPGNEIFLVFHQGWLQAEEGGLRFQPTSTQLAGKLQYTLRF